MSVLQIGDIVWQMSGREKNDLVKFHAIPHCIEYVDEHKVFFENGGGGSLGNLGRNWFLSRQECIDDFLKDHKSLEIPLSELKDTKEPIYHEERTDFQALEVVDFDSITQTSVYVGFLSDLVNYTNTLDWHKKFVNGLDMEVGTLSLTEIYEQIKAVCGGSRVITVFVENPLHGEIYQCGNYEDGKWVKLGNTMGYA